MDFSTYTFEETRHQQNFFCFCSDREPPSGRSCILRIYREQLGLGEGRSSTECRSCDNVFCHIELTKITAAVSERTNIADSLIRLINTAAYQTSATVPPADGMLWISNVVKKVTVSDGCFAGVSPESHRFMFRVKRWQNQTSTESAWML